VSTYWCFLAVLYTITYSNLNPDGFNQVNHLRKFILNTRKIDDYWNWLENSFVENTRAQQWYNGDPPRNLSGYMNDKTNRLIGWISNQTTQIYNSSIRMDKSRNKSGGM
jgi:V8-like Glu-specific endopeptidase